MKCSLRQVRKVIFITALVLLAGGIGWRLGVSGVGFGKKNLPVVKISKTLPAGKENLDFSLFWEVWDRLSASYFDKSVLNPAKMIYGAIQGMVAALDDPYTVFLPPSENKLMKDDLNGLFEGVGIQLGYKDEKLAVVAPLSGMPAQKVGVRAGDLILEIDDQGTDGLTLPEAVKKIRGPKGTKVKLVLLHEEEKEPYEVVITRETIIVPSVEVKFLEVNESTKIAHLQLTRFGDRTNEEWDAAITEILENLPAESGLILDLRNNPGGYLSSSIFIASEFLSSGTVVQQESANGLKEAFPVNRRGKLTSRRLVVLVNEGSASASEIVAGALQDYQQAKIVGSKTFGKGTIQEAQDLAGGSGLHVTTSRWLLPKGRWIDKVGVTPDYEVKDDPKTEADEQLEKAKEILLNY